MYQRLANQIQKQLNSLVDQYDAQLRTVPGYANLPDSTRRDLEQHVLQIMVECLKADSASRLIQYIHERAEEVLAHGFQPEWFQQAVIIPQDLIAPLAKTVAESDFIWRTLGQAQTMVWEIVARERRYLEQQSKESLARRDIQVRTSTEVAQEIASATDLNELFQRVVTLIKERFNYYHVQLFRYDPTQDRVILLTGYGEIGQRMMAAGHHLPMSRGVVGTAAASGQAILAADVAQTEDWHPNPNLPETKGELAVPIKLRQEVLGILDVQSDRVGALTDEDRIVLQGLCGQIAIALESKRLIDNIRRSERLLRAIIEVVPENLYVKTRQSEFILANKAVLNQLHCQSVEELAGKTDFDFYPREMAEKFYQDEQALFELGKPLLNVEEPSLDAQGRPAWRLTTKVFLYNEAGDIEGLVGLGRNITEHKQTEAALAEERNRLRTLIDSLPHYVYVKDRDSRFVTNNAAHLRLIGAQSQEEVVGKRDFDYFPPEVAQHYYDDEQKLMDIGQPLINHEEVVIDPATGQKLWALATKVPLHDQQGKVTGFVGFTQDITERKQTEETLHREETLLSEALKIAKLAYWEYDVERDRFLFNDQFYALFHTTVEQQGGYELSSEQYARTFVYPDDLPVVGTEIERALHSTDRHYSRSLVHRIQYADGGVGYISVNINIDRDERGKILRYYGANQDITDRKRAEEEVARSAKLLDTIINVSPDLIYIKDTDSRFLMASQATARLMGAPSAADLIGKNDYDFFPYELAHKYYTDEQRLIKEGKPVFGIEEPSVYPDGTKIWLLTTKVPYRAPDGTLLGIVGIGRDITDRKRSEQKMEETLRETERLYAAVSHEGWQAYRQTGVLQEGYLFDNVSINSAKDVWEPEIAQAVDRRASVTSHSEQRAVAVTPLAVRGDTIGALGVYDDPTQPLSAEDLQLIETVAEQVALALESARLFDQTQRDAERERTINRVTSRIRNARSVDEVMTIAAQELRLATRVSRSVVEILPTTEQAARSGNGEGVKA